MTDPLAYAALCKAENALTHARQYMSTTNHRAKAKEFVDIAWCVARSSNSNTAMANLHAVQKATTHTTLDEVIAAIDTQLSALVWIQSVGKPDLLSAIAKFAQSFTRFYGRVMTASGATADFVAEGFPKLIKNLDLVVGGDEGFIKCASALIVSQDLMRDVGDNGRKTFENRLAESCIGKTNEGVTASLIDSSTTEISAGADPLASLRAGIRAAGPSAGYAIAAPAGDVAWLSTCVENRGQMSVRGGTFSPGIEIVAIDDATSMVVIPASRLVYIDGGLELRPSGHATVTMADDFTAEGEQVSLWQANLQGLLVERRWRLAGDTSGCVIVG